jgi:hypothetical protein
MPVVEPLPTPEGGKFFLNVVNGVTWGFNQVRDIKADTGQILRPHEMR